MITILEAIKLSTEYLEKKDVESPRTNAEILLAEVLNCKRLELYLSFDKPLKEDELNIYREFIRKRGMRIPLQYIIGSVEFYGMNLYVNENVLIPRPETEQLVEQIINDNSQRTGLRIMDIGAGSGNISIALVNNLNKCEVIGIDISEKALAVARSNYEIYPSENKLYFKQFDIMNNDVNQLGKFDLIVSNPPYVSLNDYQNLEPELRVHEPIEALTDNLDGISFYKKIIALSNSMLNSNGKIYFEIGKDQYQIIFDIMKNCGFDEIKIIKDYAGIERIICGELQ
jgi:release factor glutamine methyltransferase